LREAADMAVDMAVVMAADMAAVMDTVGVMDMVAVTSTSTVAAGILPAPIISAGMADEASIRREAPRSAPAMSEVR
jgi:hypothetical protein